MKKVFFRYAALLVGLCMLAGCTPTGGDAAENKFTLGSQAQVDFSSADWEAALTGDGGVYQIVYDFSAADSELKPRTVYSYDSFVAINNESRKAYAKNNQELSVNTAYPESIPNERYRVVADENAFNAFYELIVKASFSEKASTLKAGEATVDFKLTDGSGNETVYTIDRAGNIARNNSEYAANGIDEAATAYFFAIMNAYRSAAQTEQLYSSSPLSIPESEAVCIIHNGETSYITAEKADEFIRLVSTDINKYSCTARINCGIGEHGEKLLDFIVGGYDAQTGMSESAKKFELYSDGKVVYRTNDLVSAGTLDHDHICDRLIFERCFVSTSAFDTEMILRFVAGLK